MANDERDQEREFLTGLKARTGRDLAEWMAAITAQGFQDKNEIIDWLRAEGLPFARASWLERIHRNGGKPIHAAAQPSTPAAEPDHAGRTSGRGVPTVSARPAATPPRLVVVPQVPRPQPSAVAAPPPRAPSQPTMQVVAAQPAPPPVQAAPAEPGPAPRASEPKPAPKATKKAPKPPPRVEGPADPAVLEKLVAAAKGYRPLYHHLEAQIRRAIPSAVIGTHERYVAIGAPLEFAAVTLHPTEVRLGLALGDHPFDAQVQQAKMRGPGPTITHMVVLTDARQVNDALLALLKAANAQSNGPA
jgi:hypothetical protein